jgi:cytochrome P450
MSVNILLRAGLVVAILIVGVFGQRYIKRRNYVRKAKKLNVQPVKAENGPWSSFIFSRRLFSNNASGDLIHRMEQVFDGNQDSPTISFQVSGSNTILTEDPEIAKTCLSTNFKDYDIGLRAVALGPLLKNGIFTQNGEAWKHSRAMIRPLFAKEQLSQLHAIEGRFQVLLNVVKENAKQGNQPFDIMPFLVRFTMDTITDYLFGETVNSLQDPAIPYQPDRPVQPAEFTDSLTRYVSPMLSKRLSAGKFYWLVDGFRFRKHIGKLHKFIDYYVERGLENVKNGKVNANRFIFVQELAKETSDAVFIRQQTANVLFAGRGTTAFLLSYSLYRLGVNKNIFAKLKAIVLEEFGRDKENITYEGLRRCSYLNNFIHEVLRIDPLVPFNVKRAIRDTILPRGGGEDGSEPVLLQKGDLIMVFTFGILRSPRLWGEDAREFNPDRWNDGRRSWDFIPFGGGPRICVGQQFALIEGAYALVRMMQEFKDIEVIPDKDNPHDPKLRFTIGAVLYDGCNISIQFEKDE